MGRIGNSTKGISIGGGMRPDTYMYCAMVSFLLSMVDYSIKSTHFNFLGGSSPSQCVLLFFHGRSWILIASGRICWRSPETFLTVVRRWYSAPALAVHHPSGFPPLRVVRGDARRGTRIRPLLRVVGSVEAILVECWTWRTLYEENNSFQFFTKKNR